MARGTTLGELVDQLRIEAKLDPNPATSINLVPGMKQQLRTTQERLYDEFDWPFLRVYPEKQLQAGERYYDVPTTLNLERIIAIDVKWGTRWQPVERGITLDHYNVYDSDEDIRVDPVMRWDVKDTGSGPQVEVWPIPVTDYDAASGDGALRFTGIRKLNPLVANSDAADLDDQMIVKFVAAGMLTSRKDPEATVRLIEARSRKKTLQGRVTKTRTASFGLGTGQDDRLDRGGRPPPLVAYVR